MPVSKLKLEETEMLKIAPYSCIAKSIQNENQNQLLFPTHFFVLPTISILGIDSSVPLNSVLESDLLKFALKDLDLIFHDKIRDE